MGSPRLTCRNRRTSNLRIPIIARGSNSSSVERFSAALAREESIVSDKWLVQVFPFTHLDLSPRVQYIVLKLEKL